MPPPSQPWDPALYQSAHAFVWQKASDLIDLLAPRAGERVLDLGCGTGQLAAKIAERGAEVSGIDQSAEMVEQARRNVPHIQVDVADATNFTVDRPFDAVFSNATLHWVKPPEAAAACIYAALKPGGRFVAEFGGRGNVLRIVTALGAALSDVARIDFEPQATWFFPSIAEYASILENQGFEVTFATLFDRPTPLDGGEAGLSNWLRMFGAAMLKPLDPATQSAVIDAACDNARIDLFRDGVWTADYRRLRIVAVRPVEMGKRV